MSRTSCSDSKTYDPRWAYVHMLPEQLVQAHLDLRGRQLLPIHNGTFDLAMHTREDPFERVRYCNRASLTAWLWPHKAFAARSR